MYKFLALLVLVAVANAQWRDGVVDSRCPNPNQDFPTFLPGPTCNSFFICNDGVRYPFTCPDGNHWNTAKNTCDLPEDAGCARRRFELPVEEQ